MLAPRISGERVGGGSLVMVVERFSCNIALVKSSLKEFVFRVQNNRIFSVFRLHGRHL